MSREYQIWKGIVARCANPSNKAFARYGGRGIAICEQWRHSFAEFSRHVGPRPSPLHSIDRINNGGNYEPGNVRWATAAEQHRNMRTNINVTFNGLTLTAADWADRLGIPRHVLYLRLRRGWPIERALSGDLKSNVAHDDLAGQRYGRLVVIELTGMLGGRPGWRCRCDCGNETVVQRRALVHSGGTRSCGCAQHHRDPDGQWSAAG